MTIPIGSITIDNNNNNPTKEILASSGIFNGIKYADTPYALDLPNTSTANTGINTTTTSTTTTGSPGYPFYGADFTTSQTEPIDDMLIFNDYIHYSAGIINEVKRFNPRSFLEQSIVTFNAYTLGHNV